MKAALVIMAAGMGSRYGGNKQIDGIGPNGEILMEYSIFDAMRAGFTKVVFIIKPDMVDLIKRICGDKLEKSVSADGEPVEVRYVFQDFSCVPSFYSIPEQRTKPFGTAHAVLCARDVISEPFVVINADDYYGADAFSEAYRELGRLKDTGEATMVGYMLKNTVSRFGTVTRGICREAGGKLEKVTETFDITLFDDGSIRDMASGGEGVLLDPDSVVSMNFWGFTPWIFGKLEEYFDSFLRSLPEGELKKECLLPSLVDELIGKGQLSVSVLHTDAVWFGMTYKEDRENVASEILKFHEKGVYPKSLH